jgi:transposase InsO family protein
VSKFRLISAEKANYPVSMMCRVLEVSRSGFYAWYKRPPSARQISDQQLAQEILVVHLAGRGCYGTRRVQRGLRAAGMRVGHKRVTRIRRQHGLTVARRRRFRVTTNSNHGRPVCANVLARSFCVRSPNTAWVSDVTYVWTEEGWPYLAAILDLCSSRVVGWATSPNNDCNLALEALRRACALRKPPTGWLHHSDRGSVYASDQYRLELQRLGGVQSMSRKGDCWDNAVAESFFASITRECLARHTLCARAQATALINDYIDVFYNLCRMHSSLSYESPVGFELKLQSRLQAA